MERFISEVSTPCLADLKAGNLRPDRFYGELLRRAGGPSGLLAPRTSHTPQVLWHDRTPPTKLGNVSLSHASLLLCVWDSPMITRWAATPLTIDRVWPQAAAECTRVTSQS